MDFRILSTSRCRAIQLVALLAGLLTACGDPPGPPGPPVPLREDVSRPNLVVIYTDDQGYGDVSALNPDAKFTTPRIDQLAAEGMSFTDAHSCGTVCTPSRYALLTGRYAWRTREMKSGVAVAEGSCLIEADRLTIGSLLQQQGYHTAMIGKWHLRMEFPGTIGRRDWSQPIQDGPTTRGFEYFYGIPASMNFGILTYIENDRVTAPPIAWTTKKPGRVRGDDFSYRIMPPYQDQGGYKADLEVAPDFVDSEVLSKLTDKAIAYLEHVGDDALRDVPFFLYVALTSPHRPVCPQSQFVGSSKAGLYGDFMVETDYRVGQILDALDKHTLTDHTIVVFTSDNGPETTYRSRIRLFDHHSSGRFKGGKRDIYEGGHRVPFIVRWPGVVDAGATCGEPISQTDLFATMADLLEVELPDDAGEDSWSLMPALSGEAQESGRGPIIHHSSDGYLAIRHGRWKLNMLRGSGGSLEPVWRKPGPGEPPFELYDMLEDPGETMNLHDERPDVVEHMTARLTEIVRSGRSRPGRPVGNDGPSWWRQLTWLSSTP
jgi:arylsulfatase A